MPPNISVTDYRLTAENLAMNEKYTSEQFVFFNYTVTVPRFDATRPAELPVHKAWRYELIWDGYATEMKVTWTRINSDGDSYNTLVERPFYFHGVSTILFFVLAVASD